MVKFSCCTIHILLILLYLTNTVFTSGHKCRENDCSLLNSTSHKSNNTGKNTINLNRVTPRLFGSTFQSVLKSIIHFYDIIEPELKIGTCFIKYFELMSFDDMFEERRWKREIQPIGEDRSMGIISQERPMGILTQYRSVRHNRPYQTNKSSSIKNLQNRFSIKQIVRVAIHGLFRFLVNLLPFPLPFLIRTVFRITMKYGFKLYSSVREDEMMRCSFSYMTTRIWHWVRNH